MSVVALIGAKGGVGTTALALDIARRVGRATIVDLDLTHGDLAHRAEVHVSATVVDLAALAADGPLEASHVDAVTYPAGCGGLRVVPSPAHPELAELAACLPVLELLASLTGSGPVIVDCGSRIDAATLRACAAADDVLIVARPDESCARQTRVVVELLERAGIDRAPQVAVPGVSARVRRGFARGVGLAPWIDARRTGLLQRVPRPSSPWRHPARATVAG